MSVSIAKTVNVLVLWAGAVLISGYKKQIIIKSWYLSHCSILCVNPMTHMLPYQKKGWHDCSWRPFVHNHHKYTPVYNALLPCLAFHVDSFNLLPEKSLWLSEAVRGTNLRLIWNWITKWWKWIWSISEGTGGLKYTAEPRHGWKCYWKVQCI